MADLGFLGEFLETFFLLLKGLLGFCGDLLLPVLLFGRFLGSLFGSSCPRRGGLEVLRRRRGTVGTAHTPSVAQ